MRAGVHHHVPAEPPRLEDLCEHALSRGVNPLVYWPVRLVLVPFFLAYFRLVRTGRERIPRTGPVLLAANHRSFLDPFIIGALTTRPVYYVAKRELFQSRWRAWLLNSLGAFPIDRGASDEQAIATARSILQRGDCVVIFPEGTRVRPGPLGAPRRGVGRLALETGAPVVPVALIGTEDVRRGWRVRPRKVVVRCGRPLRFPPAADAAGRLAASGPVPAAPVSAVPTAAAVSAVPTAAAVSAVPTAAAVSAVPTAATVPAATTAPAATLSAVPVVPVSAATAPAWVPPPELAAAATERIWACVSLQWEWLGGVVPARRPHPSEGRPSGAVHARAA